MVFGDVFKLIMPSTTVFKGKNTPTAVFCLVLSSVQSDVTFGMGKYAPCAYDPASGEYSVTLPLTALTANTRVLVRVL